MQLPTLRPWPLPLELDLLILSYLSPRDSSAFSRASRGCLRIIQRHDESLFATSTIKPERFKNLSWRQIASNQYRYPQNSKAVKRSKNPFKKDSTIQRIGKMLCLTLKDELRLIDYTARIFRILPKDHRVVDASFLSALIFRGERYEFFDAHSQTPIKMPDGVEVDPSQPAILCYEGEKALIAVSVQGKKRLALSDRKKVVLLECPLESNVKLYSLKDCVAVVNGLSVSILGLEGQVIKTLTFKNEVRKCRDSLNELWISTHHEIVVYDRALNEKKIFPIGHPEVIYVKGFLVEFRAGRFIAAGEKVAYSKPLDEELRVQYMKEENGLLYLKLNRLPFVYDPKNNKLTVIDIGFLTRCHFYWIENHLIYLTCLGEAFKMVG